ncbi:unnamed protein product [Ixodes persulcatus]
MTASATSQNVTLPCRRDNMTTELIPSRKCNHTVTPDGHVTFLCKVLLQTSPQKWFIPAEPQILTMDELFVTDEPLIGMRPGDELACISLHRVRFIKWRDFPPSMYKFYDEHGPFEIHEFLMFLRSLETQVVFQRPVQMGAVNCTSLGREGRCNFEVFGFNDMVYYNKILNDLELNENYGLTVIVEIMRTWKLSYTHVEQLNVTFIETVESIPSVILEAISFAKIRRIVFHQCNFKSIGFNELPHMRYLKELDFYEVPIGRIDPFAFDMLPDLKRVSFVRSRLRQIPPAIYEFKHIKTLVLLKTVSSSKHPFKLFQQSCKLQSSLEHLDLGLTVLGSLPNRAFCDFPNLRTLDLSGCRLVHLNETPFVGLTRLKVLNLQFNRITSLSDHVFSGLENLRTLNLSINRINILPGNRPFLPLTGLEALGLNQNNVRNILPETFRNLTVRSLTLSRNHISNWTRPIFSTMSNLRHLELDRNIMFKLDDVMFNDLSGIQEVSVCKNPWDCSSCYLKHLQDFLAQSRRHCCSDCAVCEHPEALANVSVSLAPWNADQCKPADYYVLLGLPLVLSALVLSIVSHAVYANRWYVRYLLLYLTVKMRGYKRIRHDAHYLWDAFLSYHSSEADWVRNVLLPGLETSSTGLSICVAERDFIAGVPITENICNSIAHSRKSVFLLSREFCQSRWCMFEVSLAQHRLFEAERENHIVFLKKGQIPEDEMSPILNFLVKSRTYIAVPDEGTNQNIRDLFWLQLQAALQH